MKKSTSIKYIEETQQHNPKRNKRRFLFRAKLGLNSILRETKIQEKEEIRVEEPQE